MPAFYRDDYCSACRNVPTGCRSVACALHGEGCWCLLRKRWDCDPEKPLVGVSKISVRFVCFRTRRRWRRVWAVKLYVVAHAGLFVQATKAPVCVPLLLGVFNCVAFMRPVLDQHKSRGVCRVVRHSDEATFLLSRKKSP